MQYLGFLWIILSAISFGMMPIFATFAYRSGLEIDTILLFRFGLAALLLNLYVSFKGYRYPPVKTVMILIVMGAVLYAFQAFAYFTAVDMIGASLTSILLYLYPAIVLILSIVLLRTKIHKLDILALAFTTLGAILVVGLRFQNINFIGIMFGLGAALVYSVYILVGTKAMQGTNAIVAASIIISSAAFTYITHGLYTGITIPNTTEQWKWLIALALFSTVVAIVTFFAGLKIVGPVKASMLSTLELVITFVFSFLLLDEQMGMTQILGAVCIMAASFLLAWESKTLVEEEK